MSSIKNLAGDTLIYGLSTVLGRFLNFLLVPFYTRVFLPEEYGVVTELYAYITFLLVLYTYGMETAFFRYAERSGTPKRVFSISFYSLAVTSVLLSLLIWMAAPWIAPAMGYGGQEELIQWTALILLFDTWVVIPFAFLRFQRKALRFSILKLMHILLNIGFNVWFLLVCPWLLENNFMTRLVQSVYDPAFGAGYVLISNALASLFVLPMFLKDFRQLQPHFDWQQWKTMLAFSLPLVAVGLAGMVNEVSDRIMLRHLLPYDASVRLHHLGVYGACYKLSIFMTLVVQAFRFAAEPFFFKQYAEQDAASVYARVMLYFVAGGTFLFMGVSLFLDPIKFIIAPAYHEGIHIVPVLLMANLFLGIFYNASVWYKVTGKTYAGAVIAISGAALTITGNFLLIPLIGYTGAAITTLFCYVFMSIFSIAWGRRYYKIPYDFGLMTALLFAGLALYLAGAGLKHVTELPYAADMALNLVLLGGYLLFVKNKMKLNIRQISKLIGKG